jgi:hypothetical protein
MQFRIQVVSCWGGGAISRFLMSLPPNPPERPQFPWFHVCPFPDDDKKQSRMNWRFLILKLKLTKLRGLSPQANYTDRATAAVGEVVPTCG